MTTTEASKVPSQMKPDTTTLVCSPDEQLQMFYNSGGPRAHLFHSSKILWNPKVHKYSAQGQTCQGHLNGEMNNISGSGI